MLVWAVLVAGPLILPASLLFGSWVPDIASQILQAVGAVTLFLAICALDGVGTGAAGARRDEGSRASD